MNLFICNYGNAGRLLLLNEDRIVAEKELISSGKTAENTLVVVDEMLADAGFKIEDIEKILIVIGPGYFTALRVAVMIGNMLSMSLGVSLIGINTFEYMHAVVSGSSYKEDVDNFVLASGSKELFVCKDGDFNNVEVKKKDEFFADVFGDAPEDAEGFVNGAGEWVSLSAVISTVDMHKALSPLFDREGKSNLEPTYFKGANITKSKK